MEKSSNTSLDFLLSQVEKPGRYAGGELNTIIKSPEDVDLSTCLIYPDTYEVGMPFLGFQILYHLINREDRLSAERSFAPWTDMEELLRKNKAPLFSLETRTALKDFDILGFTLPYEMNYTNILNIMDLGQVPVLNKDRTESHPIIMAGGSCSYNPEPLIDFVDVFLIGDGEETTVPLFHKIRELKLAGHSRKEILSALNQPEKGLYVPEFYNKESQAPVKAQKVTSLKNDYYPEKPYIPVIDIAQDRFTLEIQRGCTEGCRFCQAGMIYRPVRERSADDMMEFSKINLDQSGYEEMSLLSLSTSDYSDLDSFLKKLKPYTDEHHISVSFPSMRLDNISPAILDMAASQRKSGFTFAPEAGSQRLRNVINKNISDDDLYSTVELALKRGWKTLKFYYMLGLPTETDEDLQALVNQIYHIKSLTRPYGKIKINVTLSSFIPKAFTPFQWERQCSTEELQDKIDFIKGKIHVKNINLKSRDPETTLIEGILARGGAECGTLIHNAWASGAKFDAWKDKFNSNIWRNALEDAKTQTEEILKERSEKDSLPWDFIDTGITKEYLLEEMKNAVQEKTTKDCRDGCTTCGVCDFKELKMDIATPTSDIQDTAKTTPEEVETLLENRRLYRLKFSKTGKLRYAGHHDLFRMFQRATNILRLPVLYSSGFNKRPKISLGYPIPMTYEAFGEYLDLESTEPIQDLPNKLNSVFPPGLEILEAREIERNSPSIMAATKRLCYRVEFYPNQEITHALTKLDSLLASETLPIIRYHPKKPDKKVDVRPFIQSLVRLNDTSVQICFNIIDSRAVRLSEFVGLLFPDQPNPAFLGSRIETLI